MYEGLQIIIKLKISEPLKQVLPCIQCCMHLHLSDQVLLQPYTFAFIYL